MRNIILSILTLCLFSSCSHKVYDALDWQSNVIFADSKIPKWTDPLRFYDTKSKINYTLTNDRHNLYVWMKISDETEQLKILRGGMELRIDTSGKKTFPVALMFPLANQPMMMHRSTEPQSEKRNPKPDRSSMMQNLLIQAKEMELTGFKPPLGGIVSLLNNSNGISAAIETDSLGILCYQAIIPFKTFYKDELAAVDSNKAFKYEIKVNALPEPQSHTGGGGGGMGGGGSHGGGHNNGGGYSAGNSELYVTNKLTKLLRFSYK